MRQNKKVLSGHFSTEGNGERGTSLHTEYFFKPQAALQVSSVQKSEVLVRICAAAVPHLHLKLA